MGVTAEKGEIGEAEVIADLRRQGHGIAIPLGHSHPFDLILIRRDTGALERVQVKFTTSDGRRVVVRCASHSDWVSYYYTAAKVDWLATFDATSNRVYYLHSCQWDGASGVALRLEPSANGQAKGIRWAANFTRPVCDVCGAGEGSRTPDLAITNRLLCQLSYPGGS